MWRKEGRYRDAGELTGEPPTKEFTEVEIKVPWGHLAGKWYGPTDVQPILGLHGWLDNAGTFDTLVPLLPDNIAFLALDLPGHGLSSPLPPGCNYHNVDNLYVLLMIMREYRWQRIALMGHSMSAIIAFVFAAIFPERTHMVVAIDSLKPHQRAPAPLIRTIGKRIEAFVREDERHRSANEPPSYSYEDIVERQYVGALHSIDRSACKYILARNIQRSVSQPGQYFFARDRRVKFYTYHIGTQDFCVALAQRIRCPYLFIKARYAPFYEDKRHYDEIIDILKRNKNFTLLEANGTHHVHLNSPEMISATVNEFLQRHWNAPQANERQQQQHHQSKL